MVAVAGIALWIWLWLTRPDLSDLAEGFLPDVSLPLLLGGGVLFSAVNAALEELAYREVAWSALRNGGYSQGTTLLLQAIAFGTIHFQAGFPRGWIGAGLATVYGLMMGVVRWRAGGLLAAWMGHVATDFVILILLLSYVCRI